MRVKHKPVSTTMNEKRPASASTKHLLVGSRNMDARAAVCLTWIVVCLMASTGYAGGLEPGVPWVADNHDANLEGPWRCYQGIGLGHDVHFTSPGDGSSLATWVCRLGPGEYQVSVTWAAHPNRATDAPFTLWDGDAAIATVEVNQQANPSDYRAGTVAWHELGLVTLTSDTLVVELSNDADGYVIADAIRVVRLDGFEVPLGQPHVKDTDQAVCLGHWPCYVGVGFGNDVRYAAPGHGKAVTRWTFLVSPGEYQVSATWARHINRATDAPFLLHDGSHTTAVRVNQEVGPSDFVEQGTWWQELGPPISVTGNFLVIELTNDANEFVIADAIRVVRLDGKKRHLQPTLEIPPPLPVPPPEWEELPVPPASRVLEPLRHAP